MTRVTSLGIKRTHVQAELDAPEPETRVPEPESHSTLPPPKKKRKRTKKSQRDGNGAKSAAQEGQTPEPTVEDAPALKLVDSTKKSKTKKCKYALD